MSDVNVGTTNTSFVPPLTSAASPIQLPLYNVGDGGGDGTGSAAPTPSASPTPAPSGAPAVQPTAPISAAPSPASQGTPEDRSNWIPPYRLREAQEAAFRRAEQTFAQKEAQSRAELERYQAQIRSLVGVTPPQNPEIDQIKKQFGGIYPGLSKLEERAQQLEQLLERAGDLETQNEHYWTSYGRSTMNSLYTKASEAIGAPLTDEGKNLLHSFFVGYVQNSPENSARYASDPTIVDDFLKVFRSSIIDPSRRQVAAGVVNRAPQGLPQDSIGGTPMVPGAPKPRDLDERAAMGWAMHNANKQAGSF